MEKLWQDGASATVVFKGPDDEIENFLLAIKKGGSFHNTLFTKNFIESLTINRDRFEVIIGDYIYECPNYYQENIEGFHDFIHEINPHIYKLAKKFPALSFFVLYSALFAGGIQVASEDGLGCAYVIFENGKETEMEQWAWITPTYPGDNYTRHLNEREHYYWNVYKSRMTWLEKRKELFLLENKASKLMIEEIKTSLIIAEKKATENDIPYNEKVKNANKV